MKFKLSLLLASLLCAGIAIAAPITGTFQMNGVVTATATTITWDGVNGTTPDVFTLSLGTGSFASEDGTNTINNLNDTSQPVGSMFTPYNFIDLTVVPGLPAMDLNYIPMGNGGSADCTVPANGTAPPQTCTVAGSPFTLQNNNVGGAVTGSSATWTLSGVTSDGLSTWTGVFTSQFVGESYQQVLAALSASGSVTDSYSANVTVTPIATTPEPGTVFLGGMGVLFTILMRRRRSRA